MSFKINNRTPEGFVLPDIPSTILSNYPFAVIVYDTTANKFALFACSEAFYYINKEKAGINYADGLILGLKDTNTTAYETTNNGETWSQIEETEPFIPVGEVSLGEYSSYVDAVWCNHDIYIATSYNSETNEPTLGQEIYFFESKEINGIYLPRIPDGFENSYPYIAILKMTQIYSEEMKEANSDLKDVETYGLFMSPLPCINVENKELNVRYFGCENYNHYSAESIISKWEYFSEEQGLLDENIMGGSNGHITITITVFYSNHDIMEATIDSNNNITVLDSIHFSGSGFIAPPDEFSIKHSSMVHAARNARRLSGQPFTPLGLEQIMEVVNNIETFEDAEEMMF